MNTLQSKLFDQMKNAMKIKHICFPSVMDCRGAGGGRDL